MKQSDVVVNIDDLRELKKNIQNYVQNLELSCKECYQKIEETKLIFNTPTADIFREKANESILLSQKGISNNIMPLLSVLDNIISTYEEVIKQTGISVGR